MSFSNWSVSNNGNLLRNNQLLLHRVLNIIHVEDHQLFAQGLSEIILPFFPLMTIHNIQDGYEAICFIEKEIEAQNTIDLVITDINHPGLKGDKLVERMRKYEKMKGVKHTPLVVLSFVREDNFPHLIEPNNQMVNHYFSKDVEVEIIVGVLEDILYDIK